MVTSLGLRLSLVVAFGGAGGCGGPGPPPCVVL